MQIEWIRLMCAVSGRGMLPCHLEKATLMEKLLLFKLAKMRKMELYNSYIFTAKQVIFVIYQALTGRLVVSLLPIVKTARNITLDNR